MYVLELLMYALESFECMRCRNNEVTRPAPVEYHEDGSCEMMLHGIIPISGDYCLH